MTTRSPQEEAESEWLRMVTQTEVASLNLGIENGGRTCPGAALSEWLYEVNAGFSNVMAEAVSKSLTDMMTGRVVMDYLLVAFKVGYLAGKEKREFTPCVGDH